MDTVSIAGASMLLKAAQTQQAVSVSILKKTADQQNQIADLLAQNTRQATPPPPDTGFVFSIYA